MRKKYVIEFAPASRVRTEPGAIGSVPSMVVTVSAGGTNQAVAAARAVLAEYSDLARVERVALEEDVPIGINDELLARAAK